MKIGTDQGKGMFTARDFTRRAEEFALPLGIALEPDIHADHERGDHDLNPDIAKLVMAAKMPRAASVLVGVVDRPEGATVLLTLRASHLSAHAGQIAFPGGRVEDGDQTVIDTALREAHEEIALDPEAVTPVGLLEAYRTRTGYRVKPVLCVISPDINLQADEREVADIFEVPLGFLMTAANHQRYCVSLEGKSRHFYAMPYGERYIWGATAGILRIMYERLYAE